MGTVVYWREPAVRQCPLHVRFQGVKRTRYAWSDPLGASQSGRIRVTAVRTRHPRRHRGLMFAKRITFAHFSVSVAMNLPKSPGVMGIGTDPRSAIRGLIAGSAIAALISRLSMSMISAGVFFGAPKPPQPHAS